MCRPSFSSCGAFGYTDFRIDLSCAAKIELGDPTPLICREGLVQDGLLCYPPCRAGYVGVGPVCWQQCDSDQSWCVAGCARDTGDCIFALTEQLISPVVAAANIATLGANAVPSAAAGTAIEVANQLYQFATVAGEVMGWLASTLEVTNPEEAPRRAKVVSINTGNIVLDGAVSATLYGAGAIMGRQFAQDFVSQTSPEIAQALAANLDPRDVLLVQMAWADVQFWELAVTEGWNLADVALSSFGVLDPTGIVDLLAAYLKPICMEIFPFPVCTKASCLSQITSKKKEPYETLCQDIHVFATAQDNCEAEVDPMSLDGGSSDPDHDTMFWSIEPAGPFPVQDEAHTVTLTVTDAEEEEVETCTATVIVMDETPASIACPVGMSQENDPGMCGASVDYDMPLVADSCQNSSQTTQIEGLSSGSMFDVGSTTNTFEVTDSLGNVNSCNFHIGVFDTESPHITCDGLGATVSTDSDSCSATYVYQPPVGIDNCQATTVLTESPSLDPHSFPLGPSTVEYTATDLEGNSASCSFVVEVVDDTPPVAECIPLGQSGLFTIGGSDNCADTVNGGLLKAFVIDSVSGTRFPTPESPLDYYELGTTFSYSTEEGLVQEEAGNAKIQWNLQGVGSAEIIIEDAAGNLSQWARCVFESPGNGLSYEQNEFELTP